MANWRHPDKPENPLPGTRQASGNIGSERLSVERLPDIDVLRAERTTWDIWAGQGKCPSIFRTADWLATWWEIYGGEAQPWILRVSRDDQTIGYVPLMLTNRRPVPGVRVRSVEFIGAGERVCPEYLDMVCAPGTGVEISKAVDRYLLEHRDEWDRVWLSDGYEGGSLSREIGMANWPGCHHEIVPISVCPYLNLPESWDVFLMERSKHMRRKTRQIANKAERELTVDWRVFRPGDKAEDAVAMMTELHTLARQRKGEVGNFAHKRYRRFHTTIIERMAEAGRLYLGALHLNGRPAAFFYGFIFADIFFNYQAGFHPDFGRYRPGWYALGRVVRDLTGRRCRGLDFLRGDHDYKWHWSDSWRETLAGAVYSGSLAGKLSRHAAGLRRKISQQRNGVQGPPEKVRGRLKKFTPDGD